jgi:hypothetical protein
LKSSSTKRDAVGRAGSKRSNAATLQKARVSLPCRDHHMGAGLAALERRDIGDAGIAGAIGRDIRRGELQGIFVVGQCKGLRDESERQL